jgi:hypothetical protein
MALPDTASRPMTYQASQPETFAIVGKWRKIEDVVRERTKKDPNLKCFGRVW